MIYKIELEDGQIDWCTAKDILHLLKEYDKETTLDLQEIKSIDEISDEEAKSIFVHNTDYDEDNPDEMPEKICLYDLADKDGTFNVIASTEWI